MPDIAAVKAALADQRIETPSWGYGNSGTRFKVFAQAGVPRTPAREAGRRGAGARVHRRRAQGVAAHPLGQGRRLRGAGRRTRRSAGVELGAINSNVFQDDDYKLGCVSHPDPKVRRKAVDHLLECVDIMDATGSTDLKLWFADGTNYPGQDDIAARQDRLAEALADGLRAARRRPADAAGVQVLRAGLLHDRRARLGHRRTRTACKLGDKAQVVVDTGHHAPGTNIEFIVALLLREGKLGGFDFNSRFYADDDLMVGAADPFQLFRILHEVAKNGGFDPETNVAFMLDQCHNIEAKIPAVIRSVMNVQEATAKALLVDLDALRAAQRRR